MKHIKIVSLVTATIIIPWTAFFFLITKVFAIEGPLKAAAASFILMLFVSVFICIEIIEEYK